MLLSMVKFPSLNFSNRLYNLAFKVGPVFKQSFINFSSFGLLLVINTILRRVVALFIDRMVKKIIGCIKKSFRKTPKEFREQLKANLF